MNRRKTYSSSTYLQGSVKNEIRDKVTQKIDSGAYTDKAVNEMLIKLLGVPGISGGKSQQSLNSQIQNGMSAGAYSSAQMDSVSSSLKKQSNMSSTAEVGALAGGPAGAAIGAGLGLLEDVIGYYYADKAAQKAYERQNEYYENHLSMQAKVQEYQEAGLNPMGLAGAGVGATSAPSVQQANAPGGGNAAAAATQILGTLLNYKIQQKQNDIAVERNRIQEKGIDSQIELRAEQRETQRKINEWFDVNQVVNINKTVADTNLSMEKINTERVEQALKTAGISKEYAEASLKLNQSIAQAIDNNYRDAWNRNTLALQQAQTVLAYSNSAEANERVKNLIAERQNIVLNGFQIAAKTEEIKSMTRVLGFQGDISKFNVEHLAADKAWQRVGQAVSAVEGVTGAASNVMSIITGIPTPRKPIGF